jgi:two-component system, sensor histidine kinase RegB
LWHTPPVTSARVAFPSGEPSDLELGMAWLLRLRWGAAVGQGLALLVLHYVLHESLPYVWLVFLFGLTTVTNVALVRLRPRLSSRLWLPWVLSFDVLVLAAIIALTGGAANPFTVFFLVHVALSAVLLNARWTAFLTALTVVTFGLLFLLPHSPEGPPHHAMGGHHMTHEPLTVGSWASPHLLGMWVAYAFAAAFVAYFVGRLASAMRERDQRLADVAELAEQNERLALLSSFSANAAHELGSPLATIAIAAKELTLALGKTAKKTQEEADALLISQEIARCRDILSTLSARAGESMGEMPERVALGRLEEDLFRLVSRPKLRIEYAPRAGRNTPIVAPPRTLVQILNNLIQNALEAQAGLETSEPIVLTVSADDMLTFRVRDRGPGLHPSVADRIGRPFVTTKGSTGGLGLGVYLARSYAQRVGGSLTFGSASGPGLEVVLNLPRNILEARP